MIYTDFYELPDYNINEIFRYAGIKESTSALSAVADECLCECKGKFRPRVCYAEFPISSNGNEIDLSFAHITSKALAKNLCGCEKAVVFAATVGIEIDRIIQKYSKLDVSKAVFMQAIGAERIEALCDLFCARLKEIKKKQGMFLKPRFSAGYGDLPIELQKDIFRVLDCNRKIGVTLNESLLMSPSKSVTAIVGLSSSDTAAVNSGCSNCSNTDCTFRKETL